MMGEVKFTQEEDVRLETTRARFSNVLRRHGELTERLSRDSDKMIFERLQKEFEAARAAQTQEICLDGEQWNDGLLATIRERVHMEAERKAMARDADILPAAEEVLAAACDNNSDRLKMALLYNEMCKVLIENADESVEAYLAKKPAGFQLRKNLLPLETIYEGINRILSPVQQDSFSSEQNALNADLQSETATKIGEPSAPATVQVDDCKSGSEAVAERKVPILESSAKKEANRSTEQDLENIRSTSSCDVPAADSSTRTGGYVVMEEQQHCDADSSADAPGEESTKKSDPGVIILDD